MKTTIKLDLLTTDRVTLMTTRTFEDQGQEYETPPHAKAYINSVDGRDELMAEVPEPYLSAVLAVWGEKPTVTPKELER